MESVVLAQFIDAILAAADDPWRQGRLLGYVRLQESEDLVDLAKLLLEDEHRHDGTRWHCLEVLHRHVVGKVIKEEEIPRVPDWEKVTIHERTGICFHRVPAGEFWMGSEEGDQVERPVHRVRIAEDFWLAKYPVLGVEYDCFLKENGYEWLRKERWRWSKGKLGMQPAVWVSWDDLRAAGGFLEWSSLRLPNEAEWEYACRGGLEGRRWEYGFEGGAEDLRHQGWHGEEFWDFEKYLNGAGKGAHGTGLLRSNAFGLCDMHGNVWEWLEDVWDGKAYGRIVLDSQGTAWESCARTREDAGEYLRLNPYHVERVLRGGSCWYSAGHCRAAYRYRNSPEGRDRSIGFRPVLP